MRQGAGEPLQSYLNRFNEDMLFCKREFDVEALSTFKGDLNMSLLFWKDVQNNNPTTFDQLVEMITEEITKDNMILHRNRGKVFPNLMLGAGYGRGQSKPFYKQ
ncbi:Uncharacterized protein Adt_39555 [Abeliophyllum distichum]|uniref:Retrotransposon gag domain-containing protein n=1 Tax=Abeliophyllum distichum TaxID=126358 RepID=A0ABD1Q6B9_9LAMI